MDLEEKNEENVHGKELTAAAALTSLVGSRSAETHTNVALDDEDDSDHGGDEDVVGGEFLIPQKFTKSGRKRAVPFPLKLMKVLSSKDYHHIISWMPSGKSFAIHKPKVFTAEILPEHFKSAKYSSFTRKLHRWGFMRHYRGDEAGAFYHDDFQKGRIDLVEKMSCYKPQETVKPAAVARKPQTTSKQAAAPPPEPKSPTKPAAVPTIRPPAAPPVAIPRAQPVPQAPVPQHARIQNQLTSALEGLCVNPMDALQRQAVEATPDLNAIIEREVARRLEERINAAEARRQAFAFVQRQQQAKLSQLQVPPLPLQPRLPPSPFASSAWNQPGSNMNLSRTALALAAQNLAKAQQPQIRYAAIRDMPNSGLPNTNIQGAKTA